MFLRGPMVFLLGKALLINPAMQAQDTLPNFSLSRLDSNRVLFQWINPDTSLRQLSIQQSADSLTGFKTVLTVLNPSLPINGSLINRPLAGKMFYRVYLLYPKGRYIFTPAKYPRTYAPPKIPEPAKPVVNPRPNPTTINPLPSHKNDSVRVLPTYTRKDSSATPKKDSIQIKPPPVEKKKKEPPPPDPYKYVPSPYLLIDADGYPFLKLPAEWDLSQVQIRFLLESGEPLFTLNDPPFRAFRIDKANFYKSGWYKFEIWYKGNKAEFNRLYLAPEFK